MLETKLNLIRQIAQREPKTVFTSLAHHLNNEMFMGCYMQLQRGKAAGVDGQTVEQYGNKLQENITCLIERMKARKYYPQPVRRVYIPKANGEKRGLGIPAVEDKMVQLGLKTLLEPIYEQDFYSFSYGFRPNKSAHDALKEVNEVLFHKPVNYVVDVDIRKFFDTVDHKKLVELVRKRVVDPSIISLIVRMLRSGVMEEGMVNATDEGTPQGGIISPLLANIFLHYVLDDWYVTKEIEHCKGYTSMVRYADDFLVFFEHEAEAMDFMNVVRTQLALYGLTINEEKSKIVRIGRKWWKKGESETFDYLGFTHFATKNGRGDYSIGRKTKKKSLARAIKSIAQWIKGNRNKETLHDLWGVLRSKLAGHYRYYGVSGNSRSLKLFHSGTRKWIYYWVNRRSQKKTWTWNEFAEYIKKFPIPVPKIYHRLYSVAAT